MAHQAFNPHSWAFGNGHGFLPAAPQSQLGNGAGNVGAQNNHPALLNPAGFMIGAGHHVPEPADETICCVICGIPLRPTADCALIREYPGAVLDWMRPVLLAPLPAYHEATKLARYAHAYRRCDDDLLKEIRPTHFLGSGEGFIIRDETSNSKLKIFIDTRKDCKDLPAPLHEGCLHVARQFCKYQSSFHIDFRAADGGAPSSIAHLWEIWTKRLIWTCPGGVLDVPILEPLNYLGAPLHTNLIKYVRELRSHPHLLKYQADPTNIGNLTDIVVRHLRRIPEDDTYPPPKVEYLVALMEARLPQELMYHVMENMEPFVDESLTCTRVLPPRWWHDKLFTHHIIPWLWDLDLNVLEATRVAQGIDIEDESCWDWELLVRQLSQSNVLEAGGILHGASDQLWNRYRIWTLLGKARLGHLAYRPIDT
ncbi:hypothetical protein DL771_001631 [Monosporascus sp. 5C6A]|nr:hypothetical protein DL771_001631 [Monosporascus sp. 5C6A]